MHFSWDNAFKTLRNLTLIHNSSARSKPLFPSNQFFPSFHQMSHVTKDPKGSLRCWVLFEKKMSRLTTKQLVHFIADTSSWKAGGKPRSISTANYDDAVQKPSHRGIIIKIHFKNMNNALILFSHFFIQTTVLIGIFTGWGMFTGRFWARFQERICLSRRESCPYGLYVHSQPNCLSSASKRNTLNTSFRNDLTITDVLRGILRVIPTEESYAACRTFGNWKGKCNMCLLSAFILCTQVLSKPNSLTGFYSCKCAFRVTGAIPPVIDHRLKTQMCLACWSPSWTSSHALLSLQTEFCKLVLRGATTENHRTWSN